MKLRQKAGESVQSLRIQNVKHEITGSIANDGQPTDYLKSIPY